MTLGNDNGTDGQTDRRIDRQTDGQTECDAICGPSYGGGPHNNYLHDADDSDRRSATLLAKLISVCDGLSDISSFLMVACLHTTMCVKHSHVALS